MVNQTPRRNHTARASSSAALPAWLAELSKTVRAEARLRGRLRATTSIEGLLSELTRIGQIEGLGVDHELLERRPI